MALREHCHHTYLECIVQAMHSHTLTFVGLQAPQVALLCIQLALPASRIGGTSSARRTRARCTAAAARVVALWTGVGHFRIERLHLLLHFDIVTAITPRASRTNEMHHRQNKTQAKQVFIEWRNKRFKAQYNAHDKKVRNHNRLCARIYAPVALFSCSASAGVRSPPPRRSPPTASRSRCCSRTERSPPIG